MSVLSKSEFLFQAVSKDQNLNNGEEWALSTGVEIFCRRRSMLFRLLGKNWPDYTYFPGGIRHLRR